MLSLCLFVCSAFGSLLYRTALECELSTRKYIHTTTKSLEETSYYDFRVQELDRILLKMKEQLGKDAFSACVWERLERNIEVLQYPRIIKGLSKFTQEHRIRMMKNDGEVYWPSEYERDMEKSANNPTCVTVEDGTKKTQRVVAMALHYSEFNHMGGKMKRLFFLGGRMHQHLDVMERSAKKFAKSYPGKYLLWPMLEAIRHFSMSEAIKEGDYSLYERYCQVSRLIYNF